MPPYGLKILKMAQKKCQCSKQSRKWNNASKNKKKRTPPSRTPCKIFLLTFSPFPTSPQNLCHKNSKISKRMVGRSFFKYSERFKVIFYAHNSSVWCPHGSVGFLRHNDIILALFVFFSCTCCLPLSWTWNVLIFKSTTVQKSSRDLFSFKKKEVAQMHDSIINFDWNLFFPCDVCFLNFLSRKSWRLKVEIIPILEHLAKLHFTGTEGTRDGFDIFINCW